MRKELFLLFLATGIFIQTSPVYAAGWQSDDFGWKYQHDSGSTPAGCWQLINDKWYYFNVDGYMKTGWLQTEGIWYYLGADGAMLTDTNTPDGFYVDGSGCWVQDMGEWDNEDVWEEFEDFLSNRRNKYSYYAVEDVNNDGVDELFCASRLEHSQFQETGQPMLDDESGCIMFGYDGDDVVTISKITAGGMEISLKAGGQGVAWSSRFQTTLYRVKNNEIEGIQTWAQTPNAFVSETIPKVFSVGGVEVDSDTYYNSFGELEGMRELVFIKNNY